MSDIADLDAYRRRRDRDQNRCWDLSQMHPDRAEEFINAIIGESLVDMVDGEVPPVVIPDRFRS